MTSFDPSDTDEIVSTYLDGEATAEERAMVEGSPELLARVAVFRANADQVAEPVVQQDAELRAAHIAAALESATFTAPNVTSMATTRAADRWGGGRGVAAALGAAAVVLVALVFGISQFSDNSTDDTAAELTSSEATVDEAGDAMAEGTADTDSGDTDAGDDGEMATEVAAEAAPNDTAVADLDDPVAEEGPSGDDGASEEPAQPTAEPPQSPVDVADDATRSREEGAALFLRAVAAPEELAPQLIELPDAAYVLEPGLQCLSALADLVDQNTEDLLVGATVPVNGEPAEVFGIGTSGSRIDRYIVVDPSSGCSVLVNDLL